jgi:cysteine synthase A
MDIVVGVSDRSSDALNLLFNDSFGRTYLAKRRHLDEAFVKELSHFGLSGNANIVAAIKIAKHFDLDESDAIITVATDSAAMYGSERAAYVNRNYPDGFDGVHAGEIYGQHLAGIEDDHLNELSHVDRKRVFNLGYYTWVEQQGVSLEDFDKRKHQKFWTDLQATIPAWDKLISEFNVDTGAMHAG